MILGPRRSPVHQSSPLQNRKVKTIRKEVKTIKTEACLFFAWLEATSVFCFHFGFECNFKLQIVKREKKRRTTENSHLCKHEISFEFRHHKIQSKCHMDSRGQGRRGNTVRILQKDHRTNCCQYQQEDKFESFGALHRRKWPSIHCTVSIPTKRDTPVHCNLLPAHKKFEIIEN